MTNEEFEQRINSIIERQELIAEQQRITGEQIAALTQSQAEYNERIARFERSYTAIASLLGKHDTQIVELTDSLNSLTRTVERYINARGSNGTGG